MDKDSFEKLVREALTELPRLFQEKMENVEIVIENWPTPAQLASVGLPPNSLLFGLYHGVPKTKRGSYYSALPDKISLFAGPILVINRTPEQVKARVKQVVRHEIGHHFGMSEKEIREAEKGENEP